MSEQSIDVAIDYLTAKSKSLGKLGSKVRSRLKELEKRVIDTHPAVDALVHVNLSNGDTADFGFSRREAKFWIRLRQENGYSYSFDDVPLYLAAECYRHIDALIASLVDNTQALEKSLETIA